MKCKRSLTIKSVDWTPILFCLQHYEFYTQSVPLINPLIQNLPTKTKNFNQKKSKRERREDKIAESIVDTYHDGRKSLF